MCSDILISVDVEHSDNLLSGRKTVEVRRRRPRIEPGTRVWIYTKVPRAAIEAVGIVEEVHGASAGVLWKRYSAEVAISRTRLVEYLAGASSSCAIKFSSITPLQRSIGLDEIRQAVGAFQPPQFFKRLRSSEKELLLLRGQT
ncbi:MAG TPA: hypothetical protein DEH78_26480 [Solibacterales bacterium]|nr:hypothetical protein [Bryobacterales bacterium]